MIGAHCWICCDRGPDYTIALTPDGAAPPRKGPSVTLEFTCSNCGRYWSWRAVLFNGVWRYVAILPAPTRPAPRLT